MRYVLGPVLLLLMVGFAKTESPPLFQSTLFSPMTYGKYTKETYLDSEGLPSSGKFKSAIPVKKFAVITILFPVESAKVRFQGKLLYGYGACRQYYSPDLDKEKKHHYDIEADWRTGGKSYHYERRIDIEPGKRYFVNFNADPAGEIREILEQKY